MKVKDIVQRLHERYQPDDNLAVFWWDKDSFGIQGEADTNGVWDSVVAEIEEDVLPAETELGEAIEELIIEKGAVTE